MEKTPSDERLIQLVAENIRALLESRGLKAHHLVKRCGGKSLSTIQRAMDGTTDPQITTIAAIARALNVEPWQLLISNFDPEFPPALLTEEVRDTLSKLLRPSPSPTRTKS